MMKHLILLAGLLAGLRGYAQWTTLSLPVSSRYDDICFTDPQTGWVAGNGRIYKTTDAGQTWAPQYYAGKYLRCIKFATPQLGYCGSLSSSLYRTTDGGQTWVDVAPAMTQTIAGICGLSTPNSSVVYGCGIWSEPAYIVKSADAGQTWSKIDMSAYASSLIDIHFTTPDTGFVTGTASPATDGGIILYTTDGGVNWTTKYKTLVANDRVWKIQSPDGQHYFASIEAEPTVNQVRMLRSTDAGANWSLSVVRNYHSYVQTVGFLTPLLGWTGGYDRLFRTQDGGLTWDSVAVGLQYNRFLRINDTTGYLTGEKVYKYSTQTSTAVQEQGPPDDIHALKVYPNPVHTMLQTELTIGNSTTCILKLLDTQGHLVHEFYHGPINAGTYPFSLSLEQFPPQTFFLVLKSNEGQIYTKLIKD